MESNEFEISIEPILINVLALLDNQISNAGTNFF